MTALMKTVRVALDCRCVITGRLRKEGCSVSLQGTPQPHVVADFDKPGSPFGENETRCDYLFVADGTEGICWSAPLELKKGSLQAGEVVRQLRAGAEVAERFVSSTKPVRFRPTAAFGNISKAARDRLKDKSSKVSFHGHAESIRLIKCGDSLMKALHP